MTRRYLFRRRITRRSPASQSARNRRPTPHCGGWLACRAVAPNAAAIRGPRRKYFRWGKDVRPRKPDETLSRHGRCARRVAFLSPRAMFSLYCSPLDYLYARFKLYQNDEKYIPHFRRTELFPSGGGTPEGKEGEQYFNVRGRTTNFTFKPAVSSERVLHEFAYNSETNGDGVKMFNLGRTRPS